MTCDPDDKRCRAEALYTQWQEGTLERTEAPAAQPIEIPGRPQRPKLVHPREVARRRLTTPEGRAALIHAITHIEFNAINLALDAVYRFRAMPNDFYGDWLKVAAEEAYHFSLLRDRLRGLGYDYGDFAAHNGLWEMAVKTADDVLVRMALVPRVLEARGLDVTPGMIERLEKIGDQSTVEILHIILRDEIGHVAIGSRWYAYACKARGVDPGETFKRLVSEAMRGRLKGPFHYDARLQAGFSEHELAGLEALDAEWSNETILDKQ